VSQFSTALHPVTFLGRPLYYVNVLRLLLSNETILEGLFKMARRRTKNPGGTRVKGGGVEKRQVLDEIIFAGGCPPR